MRVNYTNGWEALVAFCGDAELTYNGCDWTMGMNRASYIDLLAHSCMGSEEYHFMASASG